MPFSFFFLPQCKNCLFGYTGEPEIDQILTVLLSTNMLIGGVTGFILDNTMPGTREERGMTVWNQSTEEGEEGLQIYDLPFGLRKLSTYKCAKYIPFLPYYPDEEKNVAAVELKNVSTTVVDAE